MKLISTAAIDELRFFGKSATIMSDNPKNVMEYNKQSEKNKMKFMILNI